MAMDISPGPFFLKKQKEAATWEENVMENNQKNDCMFLIRENCKTEYKEASSSTEKKYVSLDSISSKYILHK